MTYPMGTTRVELMDGSVAEFKYAFALVSEERKAIAVFTEHCGHHIFPYHEAKVLQDGLLQFQQSAYPIHRADAPRRASPAAPRRS